MPPPRDPQGSAWTTCSWCGGHGIREKWTGDGCDVVDCSYCQGSGIERARDAKGRFTRG